MLLVQQNGEQCVMALHMDENCVVMSSGDLGNMRE